MISELRDDPSESFDFDKYLRGVNAIIKLFKSSIICKRKKEIYFKNKRTNTYFIKTNI
jgi:hypothetical protein